MPVLIPLAVASVGLSAYAAVQQKRSADNAAQVDTATANYNARYDEAMAEQLDADTLANIRTARQSNAVYLSHQAASYASAGVLATSGSPLDAQITNAGRMEQQIQQRWVNAQSKEASYRSQAEAGVAYGQAQAQSDRITGSIALINGGSKLLQQGYQDYDTGVFKSPSAGSSSDPSLQISGGYG